MNYIGKILCLFSIIVSATVAQSALPLDFFLDINGISIAPGIDHVCVIEKQPGIDFGGRARCFGKDDYGKLNAPVEDILVQIISGYFYSCGITMEQTVTCWGRIDNVVPGLYSQITGARHFACGVLIDGRINCWGPWNVAQNYPKEDYMKQNGIEKFVQVSCEDRHCCALDDRGHLTCWSGTHLDTQSEHLLHPSEKVIVSTDTGDSAESGDDDADFIDFFNDDDTAGTNEVPITEEEITRKIVFKQVSVGDRLTCGIRYDNSGLVCWGSVDHLLQGENFVEGPFKQVSAGRMGICALYDYDALPENPNQASARCFGVAEKLVPVTAVSEIMYDQVVVGPGSICLVTLDDYRLECHGSLYRPIPDGLEIA